MMRLLSDDQGHDRPARRRILAMAGAFYGTLALVSLGWAWLAGYDQLFWDPRRSTWLGFVLAALAGIVLGLVVTGVSRIIERYRWARELSRWLRSAMGPLRFIDALWLALLSGVIEELFFRGVLQRSLGLVAASLIFGAVHLPPSRELWPWPVMAAMLGLLFGVAVGWTGNLAFPIAAHVVINLVNLYRICGTAHIEASSAVSRGSLQQLGSAPSIGDDEG